MKSSDLNYELPEELIAQIPLEIRSDSRLMVIDQKTGLRSHEQFSNLPSFLNSGDLLIFNNSRVIPARLIGERSDGGVAEVLLLSDQGNDCWECLVRPGKKLKPGSIIQFPEGLKGTVEATTDFDGRIVRFEYSGLWLELLDRIGQMPLPPYIHAQLKDKERYQTVYSKHPGSAAAPTAGLHFTPELLKELDDKGIGMNFVTLHVGLGTFRPVQVETVTDHVMHKEYFEVTESCYNKIKVAKAEGRRVIAVGTTSVRALETLANWGESPKLSGWTDIFIYPGYSFKWVEGLVTNFHLPQSTLLMLVSALTSPKIMLDAYEEAVAERYRFFSFGDSMLIL